MRHRTPPLPASCRPALAGALPAAAARLCSAIWEARPAAAPFRGVGPASHPRLWRPTRHPLASHPLPSSRASSGGTTGPTIGSPAPLRVLELWRARPPSPSQALSGLYLAQIIPQQQANPNPSWPGSGGVGPQPWSPSLSTALVRRDSFPKAGAHPPLQVESFDLIQSAYDSSSSCDCLPLQLAP